MPPMPDETTVYALIDADLLKHHALSPEQVGRFLESEKIPIAQYRDKSASDEAVAEALEALRRNYHGTLIVNDRIDLVPLADGLHLGQEDLTAVAPDPAEAVSRVRERIGEKILGLSTHDLSEIETANALDLDYIGLGAYRPTATKGDAEVRGEELLEIARHSRHPVAIIGGVRWEDRFVPPIRYKVLGSALMERIAAS